MAKINTQIQKRYFEIIRDRIAEILADEISNQGAINYDEFLSSIVVYTNRFLPVNDSEIPCVVVGIGEGEYDNYKQLSKDGNYDFIVDVYSKAPNTDNERGDQFSSERLERTVGVIDYILSDPIYRTLGLAPPSISRVEVQGFQIAKPDESKRAKNISMARMRVRVRANESVEGAQGVLLAGYQTNVKIGTTEYGYIFSGTAPFTPVPPVCDPARIFNTDKSFYIEVNSGQQYEIPDITVTDSDGSTFEWPAVKDVICTPPVDGINNIQKSDGTLIEAVTVPSGSTVNSPVADSVITANGDFYKNVKATDPLNVEIVDTEDSPVSTTIVGGKVQVDDLPAPPEFLYDGVNFMIDPNAAYSWVTPETVAHSIAGFEKFNLINSVGFASSMWTLDGINQYVQSQSPLLWTDRENALTFHQFIFTPNNNITQPLIAPNNFNSSQGAFYLFRGSNVNVNDLLFRYYDSGGSLANTIFSDFFLGFDNANMLVSVVVDYTTGEAKAYRNGVLYSTETHTATKPTVSNNQRVGRVGGLYGEFRFGLTAMYNKVHSATEVQRLFNYFKSDYGL